MFDGRSDGAQDLALQALLRELAGAGYRFVTPTPSTHRRVAERLATARPHDLRDVLGWRRPFRPSEQNGAVVDHLAAADALEAVGTDLARSRLRASTLGDLILLHSPSGAGRDEVFLGPDSHRFAALLRREARDARPDGRFMDIGTGAGAGALTLAGLHPRAEVLAGDVNPEALRLTRINARHAGLRVVAAQSSGMAGVDGDFDVIVANPPYIAGDAGRTYRDGGDGLGTRLALDWMAEAVDRLRPGGRIILYTGSPIVDGRDRVREAMTNLAAEAGGVLAYDELDPDVFGGTLGQTAYADVERIAAVGAVLRAPA